MTRKFFAFLALLSGLVALSGAATASYAHNSSQCPSSVSASTERVEASKPAHTKRPPGKVSARTEDKDRKARTKPPRSLRMPVLMGIERAYE
ncbi:hypothetical protein [Erythrobacter sp. THAF29]|uniref:hypothetical protein n=1 Tax=Erythrobacter sp. THAF29 TaxID=2587851 RepID=UPI00126957A1|nr:hypothetical protein [Erythrobacter sp. THAF29]QFT77678.1 hypothetical protein FIU90_09025 [Erythrobacter sp. THAF29]